MADIEKKIPNDPYTTQFDLASNSKQFTVACLLLLQKQMKQSGFSLDDDIRQYIPELPVYNNKPITIRQLCTHTSGLKDYLNYMQLGKNIC
jgi:CubicO group peptidase (beta-lactamase class C family)